MQKKENFISHDVTTLYHIAFLDHFSLLTKTLWGLLQEKQEF